MQRIFMQEKPSDISIEQVFEKFLKVKECSNVAPDTISYYQRCFKSFKRFYDTSLPCNSITLDTINDYVIFLKENTKDNDITINSHLRGIRALFYYAMELGYVKSFKIKLIKAVKKIKETYTTEELNLLLKKPDMKKCNFAEYRTWVMTNYFLGTGNRLETVVNLKIGDINFQDYEIRLLRTKNKKQQIIPLSMELSKILKEYLMYRQGEPEDLLFCTEYGTKLAKRSVQTHFQKYNRERGVTKTSIHAFRHTFAKNWILNGGDIFTLQRILGHSSIEMVKEYVNMFDKDLQRGFNSFNPLDTFFKEQKKGEKIKVRK